MNHPSWIPRADCRPPAPAGLLLCALMLAAGRLAAAAPVTVETQDGKQLTGELVGLDGQGLVIETAAGREKLPPASVMSIKPGTAGAWPRRKATCRVELVDGSLLAATAYHSKGGTARIEPVGSAELEVPTRSIRSVRFVADERGDKLAKDWSQIVEGKSASDLLVVRKQGALDYLEGVLGNVDDEVVHFELDKEAIPVKRPKVEGLIYYHAKGEQLAEPLAVAVDRGGSRWQVKSLEPAGQSWNLKTPSGVTVSLAPEKLERLDLASVNTQYLGSLEPASFSYAAYFGAADRTGGSGRVEPAPSRRGIRRRTAETRRQVLQPGRGSASAQRGGLPAAGQIPAFQGRGWHRRCRPPRRRRPTGNPRGRQTTMGRQGSRLRAGPAARSGHCRRQTDRHSGRFRR